MKAMAVPDYKQILQEKVRLTRPDGQGKEELAEVINWETDRAVDEGLVNKPLSGNRAVRHRIEVRAGGRRPGKDAPGVYRDTAPHHDRNDDDVCED